MRRTPRSPLKIAASEWNRIDADSSRTGRRENRRPIVPRYVRAVGLNSSGATLVAGSPVFYGPFTSDATVTGFAANPPQGYHTLYHAFWPINSTEQTLYESQSNSMQRVGVALEDIANGDVGAIAIAGIVSVTGSAGGRRYARPTLKTGSFQTTLTGDRWGYRILATYNSWMLINLDAFYASNLLAMTKVGGLAAGAMGLVTIQDPTSAGWPTASDDYPAWTVGATIPASTLVTLIPTEDRWLALKVC